MNEKLKELYPQRETEANRDGIVAIEIEAEAYNEAFPIIDDWLVENDGSLRYFGMEFKSRRPVKETSLSEQLDTLIKGVKNIKFVENSPRTSVHVHVNVLGLTPSEIWTAVTAGWLLEPAMFRMCAPKRSGNLFCLRLQDAKGLLQLVEQDIEQSMADTGTLPFNIFRSNAYRYANLNIASVYKFGSLEVRALHGTFDKDLIETWAKMCIAFVHRSKQYGTPEKLFDFVANNGYDAFVKSVLGTDLMEKLPKISEQEYGDQMERVLPMVLLCDWDKYAKHKWNKKKDAKIKKKTEEILNNVPRNVVLNREIREMDRARLRGHGADAIIVDEVREAVFDRADPEFADDGI